MDDALKQKLSQFVDNEGKLIVQDDMPDDLKEAIKYLNDNNVNIFAPNDPMANTEESEFFTEEITPEDLVVDPDDEIGDAVDEQNTPSVDYIEENVNDDQINDLQDIF